MDVLKQLQLVVFQTGAFLIAWSWALVYYAVSHGVAGESPLEKQIGFGGQGQPQKISVLVGQYLIVCGSVSILLMQLRKHPNRFTDALAVSLEFFPSPVFAGALTSCLSQFADGFQLGLLNLVATWIVAGAVSIVPRSGRFQTFGDIVKKTVGFGLGVAWNSLATKVEPLTTHFIAQTIYVILMLLVAASLAVPELKEASLRQRHASLLAFAAKVVCAFSFSDWLGAVMPTGTLGNIYSLILLFISAAALSALVLQADLEHQPTRSDLNKNPTDRFVGFLVMIPCVWCCCPCVPLLWLLSGSRVGLKDRWLRLTADVMSLTSSIVGTNILTNGLDSSAAVLGICEVGSCDVPLFLLYAVLLAVVVSFSLLLAITPLMQQESAQSDAETRLLDDA